MNDCTTETLQTVILLWCLSPNKYLVSILCSGDFIGVFICLTISDLDMILKLSYFGMFFNYFKLCEDIFLIFQILQKILKKTADSKESLLTKKTCQYTQ